MEGLLAEVLRKPEDSTARVVLADHLQAIGDPRGELIAMSCLVAELADDDPRRPELVRRELALIREHLPGWVKELGVTEAALVRGFPDRLHTHQVRPEITNLIPLTNLKLRQLPAEAYRAICASTATPTVRDVTLMDLASKGIETAVAEMAEAPWLSQVRAFRTMGLPVTDADLLKLITRLEHLETLELESMKSEVKVTRKGLIAALAAPEFRRLRELTLQKVSLKVPGARCIATAPQADKLERMRLSQCKLGSEGARLIFGSSTLTGLRELSLRENKIDETMTIGPTLARTLHRLDLSQNELGDSWIRGFLEGPPLALEHLGVRSNELTSTGVRALIESEALPALVSLDVGTQSVRLDDSLRWGRELPSLVQLPGFARLRVLDAGMSGVTADGVAALARAPHARGLRQLCLVFNKLGFEGAVALATHEQLGNLETLELGYTGIGDDGIERLCASDRLTNLRNLDLSGNKIGERGYTALLRTKAFPKLRVLRLYDAKTRRGELEQYLGALVDLGDFVESMGRWQPED